ncbi:malonyl CoA-acyl carrier protein transacylase [Desulfolithobacter dissulfuricans]|uniref:Malonyl CoA-acyl carrier protein transacylase n=1 Tax=Desulfolithobacter dissulfuricans TaxID=2795293 RepID=A0A915XJX3_9BACT|nr:ACP S-malonyltransferase [Desulfolithobacter dissulfuricans]BCO09207.1 malonyl CoA-acyl carrier protein transacylase [Desulfolithobacter dissulfuricans]
MKKTAVIFPGQGSQYLGMGQEFMESDPEVRRLMELGEEVSGFPLRRLCSEGPLEDLTRVVHLQPALTVINLICYQQFKKALPELRPAWVAGHSLGEYSALVAADVVSERDGLRLVTRRGEFMEREGAANPGGMRAVLGLTIDEIDGLLAEYEGPGTVVVANHNSEKQVVISGDSDGLDGLSVLCQQKGGKVIPLKVSVANHSPLVAGAVADFADFMDSVLFNAPSLPMVFNVTAAPENDPDTIRSVMARQIASRVRWMESVQRMVEDGVEVFVELGPKNVLTGLMKKILPRKSGIVCLQADTPEKLEQVVQAVAG